MAIYLNFLQTHGNSHHNFILLQIYPKSLGLHVSFPVLKFLNQLSHSLCNQHKIIPIDPRSEQCFEYHTEQ